MARAAITTRTDSSLGPRRSAACAIITVQAYYVGWTGDGHIGRLNITHAFYQAFGQDNFNGIAGRRVNINAQMAALELSIDKDWLRHKLSVFYASGDDDPKDGDGTGFDTIFDRPFFIGGPFSFYVHQGFNLAGTSVNFKQRDSLVLDFRTSKAKANRTSSIPARSSSVTAPTLMSRRN